MAFHTWLAFITASVILTLIPGPSVLLVVGQAVAKGQKAAMICILGDVIGGFVLIGLSFMGVGALLAASATLFQVVKWAGVLYLAYLGYRQILDAKNDTNFISDAPQGSSTWSSFWAGLITAVLNPKAIVFYMAFLSQFIDPERSMSLQLTIMALTSAVAVIIPLAGYALLAGRVRLAFRSRAAQKRIGYTGGASLIGGSVFMAATR
ncbi:LysE family translocator [Labrenzia sp. CE80]|uniref:LysE family translocator n=1 Tax=Labrenzia sp. CE80 TaxID=1788986 RepID=UPI00129A82B7|nr:LysE family translocator [Labrenzia sp. CE80]